MFPAPTPSSQYGYACKVWLAYQLELSEFGGIHYVWFARELNPVHNGDSSNPLLLCREIDTAVKKGDSNHAKIKDLRANLLTVVTRKIRPASRPLARKLRRAILAAGVDMFRPQLWRLDLSLISSSRVSTAGATAGWDEQHVDNLAAGEFEIIVD